MRVNRKPLHSAMQRMAGEAERMMLLVDDGAPPDYATVAGIRSDYNTLADALKASYVGGKLPKGVEAFMHGLYQDIASLPFAGPKAKAKRSRKAKPAPAPDPVITYGHVWTVARDGGARPPRLELRTSRDRTRVIIRRARIERDRARLWGTCLYEVA